MEGWNFMRLIICDDNKDDVSALERLLESYAKKNKQHFDIITFDSAGELCAASEKIENSKIIFLDINIEDMDGLEAAKQIKEFYPELHVILVSAFMNYALDGYKVKASRFLLKDDLEYTLPECLDEIMKEMKSSEQVLEFDFREGLRAIRVDEIIYIETNRHIQIFYTKKNEYTIYAKMDEMEQQLSEYGFVRIHQSFLVNMRYIDKISSYVLTLKTGKELSVPKSRYSDVKKRYALFLGAN